MSTEQSKDRDGKGRHFETGDNGDDEQENREHIEETGEPKTDALGNADGAS